MTTTEHPSNLDLTRALEDLEAPACLIDREGRFTWVNRRYLELFGDRRGQVYSDTVVPEHRQRARTTFLRTVGGKTDQIFDLAVFDRDRNRLTLRISAAPIRRAGAVVGIFSIGMPLAQAPAGAGASMLTPRQLEVLGLLVQGLDTAEIARRLGVAEETARNHIRALLRAMGAHSRLEAAVMGLRLGLVAHDLTQPGHETEEPPADN
jgi:PAS domain S-box-containing protein